MNSEQSLEEEIRHNFEASSKLLKCNAELRDSILKQGEKFDREKKMLGTGKKAVGT
jgi:hypothetical protein